MNGVYVTPKVFVTTACPHVRFITELLGMLRKGPHMALGTPWKNHGKITNPGWALGFSNIWGQFRGRETKPLRDSRPPESLPKGHQAHV